MTVGDRKTSAEFLYNAAEQLDPNKTTEWFATGASYLRAIPGVGDKFDSYVGNVNLLNKTRSEGVLKGLSNIKGNANAFEGGIVDRATTGVTDPKFVTKYVSALEIAAADKDDARQRFIDAYTGDPKAVYTAWANSPDNPRLYNHPKVNQFLNEQINFGGAGGDGKARTTSQTYIANDSDIEALANKIYQDATGYGATPKQIAEAKKVLRRELRENPVVQSYNAAGNLVQSGGINAEQILAEEVAQTGAAEKTRAERANQIMLRELGGLQ